MMIDNVSKLPFNQETKNALRELVDMLISANIHCRKIVLFGSYARAEQRVTSDFDIFVLTDKEVDRYVRGELHAKFDERNSDLVFSTVTSFEKSNSLLYRRIREEGVLLWRI